jgi:hypothetical protein
MRDTKLTPEQRQSMSALMRAFIELMDDNYYQVTILDKCDILGKSPANWRDEVERLRSQPSKEHALRLEFLRGLLAEFEQTTNGSPLTELVQKMRNKNLLN